VLENIRIVLIETRHPGNIGAAARAMKVMGLKRLCLVNPQSFPDEKSFAMSAGAADLLDQAEVYESLDQAIDGCHLVVGTSARSRSIPWPVQDARESAQTLLQEPVEHELAILFGREDRGLTNEELQTCHFHLQIPSNPDYGVLNIASAVQVVSYELRMAALEQQPEAAKSDLWSWGTEWDEVPATRDQVELFFEHLEQTLVDIKVINPDNPRQLMTRMKRLFLRARPDRTEISLLRGMLTAIGKNRQQ